IETEQRLTRCTIFSSPAVGLALAQQSLRRRITHFMPLLYPFLSSSLLPSRLSSLETASAVAA
ncbi:hypothetical protein, partial [Roseiconus nitratireducens]|uniref:hypothetical protein n=1 Tax=Roseiconus nitratireducens TaxID=2605748 RepID=UPI001F3EEEBD